MNADLILRVAVGAAVVGGLIWSIFLRERFRTRSLKALAPQIGFSMVNGDGKLCLCDFRFDSPLFHIGEGRKNLAWNAMEGVAARLQTVLFDFFWETEVSSTPDDGTSNGRQTVAAFAAPNTELPSFRIMRKGPMTWFVGDKVQIDNNPEFAKRFVVTGKNQVAVQALLRPPLTSYLVSAQLQEKMIIEGSGPWLFFYRRKKRIAPPQWKDFLDQTSNVANDFIQHCAARQTLKAG